MSLILVATVGDVLLERVSVALRSDVWGYAGAEPGTRPGTVRGPHPSCSTDHCARRRVSAVRPRPEARADVRGMRWTGSFSYFPTTARTRAAASATGTS